MYLSFQFICSSTETDGTSFEVANQLTGIINDVIKENNDKFFYWIKALGQNRQDKT